MSRLVRVGVWIMAASFAPAAWTAPRVYRDAVSLTAVSSTNGGVVMREAAPRIYS